MDKSSGVMDDRTGARAGDVERSYHVITTGTEKPSRPVAGCCRWLGLLASGREGRGRNVWVNGKRVGSGRTGQDAACWLLACLDLFVIGRQQASPLAAVPCFTRLSHRHSSYYSQVMIAKLNQILVYETAQLSDFCKERLGDVHANSEGRTPKANGRRGEDIFRYFQVLSRCPYLQRARPLGDNRQASVPIKSTVYQHYLPCYAKKFHDRIHLGRHLKCPNGHSVEGYSDGAEVWLMGTFLPTNMVTKLEGDTRPLAEQRVVHEWRCSAPFFNLFTADFPGVGSLYSPSACSYSQLHLTYEPVFIRTAICHMNIDPKNILEWFFANGLKYDLGKYTVLHTTVPQVLVQILSDGGECKTPRAENSRSQKLKIRMSAQRASKHRELTQAGVFHSNQPTNESESIRRRHKRLPWSQAQHKRCILPVLEDLPYKGVVEITQ
ncbi:hypothetical protein J6590_022640 [Homalodisca vitripennis]|nr:hypothetical protein J6590_022640 [Homalodisca vitripennis]